jgi:hypothetical protein
LSGNVLISSDQAHKVERPVKDAFQHGTRNGRIASAVYPGKNLGFLGAGRRLLFKWMILAGGNPLNQVAEALLYASMFFESTKSSTSSGEKFSDNEIVSSASQVWPNTAHHLGPALFERIQVVLAVIEDNPAESVG